MAGPWLAGRDATLAAALNRGLLWPCAGAALLLARGAAEVRRVVLPAQDGSTIGAGASGRGQRRQSRRAAAYRGCSGSTGRDAAAIRRRPTAACCCMTSILLHSVENPLFCVAIDSQGCEARDRVCSVASDMEMHHVHGRRCSGGDLRRGRCSIGFSGLNILQTSQRWSDHHCRGAAVQLFSLLAAFGGGLGRSDASLPGA